jgi:hypothetical protein
VLPLSAERFSCECRPNRRNYGIEIEFRFGGVKQSTEQGQSLLRVVLLKEDDGTEQDRQGSLERAVNVCVTHPFTRKLEPCEQVAKTSAFGAVRFPVQIVEVDLRHRTES